MKIYYDPVSNGFYQTDFHKKIPTSAIEITNEVRWNLVSALSEGKMIVVEKGSIRIEERGVNLDDAVEFERNWRNDELLLADIELNKVQDSDSKAIGSVSDWRNYRKALRAWPEHEKFPDISFRPKSPK